MATSSKTKPAGEPIQSAKASKPKDTGEPQAPADQVPEKSETSTNPASPPTAAIEQVLKNDDNTKSRSLPESNDPVEPEVPSAPEYTPPSEEVGAGDTGHEQLDLLKKIQGELATLVIPDGKESVVKAQLRIMINDPNGVDSILEHFIDNLRLGNTQACAYADELEAGLSISAGSAEVDEASASQASEIKPKCSGGGEAAENAEGIRVEHITISKWSRSFGVKLNKKAIKKLAASIKKHGLLHPIILVRIPGKKNWYAVVCGAHRLAAIKLNRKGDAFLRPGEYHILPDLTEEDDACLDISASENADRNDLSPYATALYVKRLRDDEGLDQTEIADRLGMQREVANALTALPEHYDDLPKKWQQELDGVCDSDHAEKPAITVSHWRKVKGYANKHGITPELKELLETAVDEKWSTSRLGDEVAELHEPNEGDKGDGSGEGGGDGGATEDPKATPPQILEPSGPDYFNLLTTLENAIALAAEDGEIIGALNSAIATIQHRKAASEQQEVA